MAKSSRSSVVKTNNQRLKKNVFGPVEAARAERLSAKLLAIASQPKPQKDLEMKEEPGDETKDGAAEKDDSMEVDVPKPASKKSNKRKVEKRKAKKKSSIVFPMRGPKRNKK
ncbi:hypothetical protein N656DRAFT_795846 [Canariomyces notabilis]|uniref:DUF2423 domain-containing protein n=1 Tax=Canariomyces notabilis TaxID=2074819 RepID=A0AAN6TIN4_9PEZI|nr:hypothetical protein N656DRAFT_795846 [Canariomyces arenarius]